MAKRLTAKEMVEQFQEIDPLVDIDTILNAITERQKNKFTDHFWMKDRVSNETIDELKELGFKVEDYEDNHSPGPMIKISWEHLVDKVKSKEVGE